MAMEKEKYLFGFFVMRMDGCEGNYEMTMDDASASFVCGRLVSRQRCGAAEV